METTKNAKIVSSNTLNFFVVLPGLKIFTDERNGTNPAIAPSSRISLSHPKKSTTPVLILKNVSPIYTRKNTNRGSSKRTKFLEKVFNIPFKC